MGIARTVVVDSAGATMIATGLCDAVVVGGDGSLLTAMW